MAGGNGSDLYLVDNGRDVVIEEAPDGNDQIDAVISYALPDNVESLVLTTSKGLTGTGNALDNYIAGGSGSGRRASNLADYVISILY